MIAASVAEICLICKWLIQKGLMINTNPPNRPEPDGNEMRAGQSIRRFYTMSNKMSHTIRQALPGHWAMRACWMEKGQNSFFFHSFSLPFFEIGRFVLCGVPFSWNQRKWIVRLLSTRRRPTSACQMWNGFVRISVGFFLPIFALLIFVLNAHRSLCTRGRTCESGRTDERTVCVCVYECVFTETIRLNNLCPIKWNTR